MEAAPKRRLLARAEAIGRRLSLAPEIEGVCLFGSVARGTDGAYSDIDLLVVGRDTSLSPSRVRRRLLDSESERLSVICYTAAELTDLFESGSSFIHHLRTEGRILYDRSGVLERLLNGPFELQLHLADELDGELARLKPYRQLELYRGNFLFVLAQLYAIGKAVVMLGLIAERTPRYDRSEAFAALRERHPELAADLDTIEQLRPFYRIVTRRGAEPLPFAYRDSADEVSAAVDAIKRVAGAVRSAAHAHSS